VDREEEGEGESVVWLRREREVCLGESATRLREREEECGCGGRRSEAINPNFLYLYRRRLSGLDWAY
jgi:hypothetical protein